MRERSTSAFRRFLAGQAARLPLPETEGKRATRPTIVRATAPLQNERGVALILTLAILALVTLLLIAFITSMRVENVASKNFNDLIKARELAQAGVDEAVGVIRMATPPVSTLTNYVTAPGMIYTWPGSAPWSPTALFTSDPSGPNGGKEVDMNSNNVITGASSAYPTNNANSQLWVGWSNVVATVNGTPQLVGRYAYWVDDESAKVNLNVAGARVNDPSGLFPDAIDLPSLGFSTTEVGTLTNYVQNTRPLDTIQSMVMAAPPLVGNAPSVSGATFSNTQFYVTANSTSPDITPWGTKRVNLSNVVANAASKAAAVSTIASNLADPDLHTWFGQDFSQKYPSVQQIAANIVDYITTDNTPADSGNYNSTTAPLFLGLKETPYLNELVISNTFQVSNLGSGTYSLTINSYPLVELWYMYGNSAGWVPPNKPSVILLNNGGPLGGGATLTMTVGGGFDSNPISIPNGTITTGFKAMNTTVNPYLVVPQSPVAILSETFTISALGPGLPPTIPITLNPGTITAIFTSQQPGNAGRMDYAVIGFPTNVNAIISTTSGTPTPVLWAAQCNDPRVKPVSNTWAQNLVAPTLGAQNSSPTFNLSAGSGTLSGDGDMSCHTNNSANWPNSGTTGRQRGTITPGELAFIHTGVPWRTFWLEPQPSSEGNVVPDWLAVDLFSATDSTNVAGRMNVNSTINNVGGTPQRFAFPSPLSALLISGGNAANIYGFQLDAGADLPAVFATAAFTTAGEICQTKGLADGGGLKSVREAPAQAILNIITPRSDTFTIWCLAQSIKKVDKTVTNLGSFTPGTDVVTGEAKVQAVIERTVANDALGNPTQVKFRTLYYRYLYR